MSCDGCEFEWSDPCPNEATCRDQSLYHTDEECDGCVHVPKCTCMGKCRYYITEDEYDAKLAQEAKDRGDFIDWKGVN